jgi:EAL domain-containing protein (putative c-di-GMP-specific phosphodiesterase class I)
MDDFGSGYSSLNMMATLPIDVLKMDMRFIQNIEQDEKAFRLIELILDIAKYLNVPVVAEGVETDAQMDFLRQAHCEEAQGFRFSKPVSPEEIPALLRARSL